MIIIIIVLTVLLIMERREVKETKTGDTAHYVVKRGHV